MSRHNQTIIVVGLVISFVVNSVLFTLEATRRTADDLVKIIQGVKKDEQGKIDSCITAGGLPRFDHRGDFQDCGQKN